MASGSWANNTSPPKKRTAITAPKATFLTIVHPFQLKPFSHLIIRLSKQQDAQNKPFIADMTEIAGNHPPED
ncbi:MAG: hypothetical protein V3W44_06915 [Dehalococcoidales bacterium]